MDMYLYMSWQDDSMRHNETEHVLVNDKDILDKIWLPDLYFANARTAYFHKVTVHNFNMFISPQGTISYGTRVTLNLACNLDLKDYPLDYQTCYIKVISCELQILRLNDWIFFCWKFWKFFLIRKKIFIFKIFFSNFYFFFN